MPERLSLPETDCSYHLHILGRDKKRLRCLIIQRDLKQADTLLRYLDGSLLLVNHDQQQQNPQQRMA